MSEDQLHYPIMIDQAMRGVVRETLKRVQSTGLPGEHHFYISFLTGFPGVKISEQLKSRYPKEITIVMQHQYWDFKVEEAFFTVTLSFGGVPEKLSIPFAALTAFADPSIKFGLQFQHSDILEDVQDITIELPQDLTQATEEGAAEIISLDSFRKK